jgi:cytochrome c553
MSFPRLSAWMGWCFASLLSCSALPCAARSAPVFENTIAQRVMACAACHGKEGRAGPDGYYPRLAGKPAGYLYQQMLAFRDGRRHYGVMQRLLEPLSDAYLMEIAQYYAGLDLPYPAPGAVRAAPAALQRGRQLAMQGNAAGKLPACAQCHGAALTGAMPATPGLLGLPQDYLNAQLGAWRNGQRRAVAPDCMARIARQLEPEDVVAVTAWLSAQPVPANAKAGPALAPVPGLACGSAP